MEILNKETFKEKIFNFEQDKEWTFKGRRPAIVDFYADWCGPCRALTPILEELAKEYAGTVDIYKVNTELNPELASMFGIRGIPSLLFIPMNGAPAMASGLAPKESLQKAIHEIFNIAPSQQKGT
ncbi:thioredoxin [Bdellovibrio sp.]|uniref:thioredoxin n=1 Tax=Bdellovibrio TaxID=958 RepID=UPI0032221CE4